ncbi:hypothetical protein Bhyg_06435 [Pseudolycoriella hygida]|uniref:Uncharacterized protein n=1 Tax=Pseudolycoriella hygida TaxID=35572 RepID=A0A9Q0N2B6_9DIPT|nr:hypothetical protein Bhyg_06435 [Pseudolycoriella hygida]
MNRQHLHFVRCEESLHLQQH